MKDIHGHKAHNYWLILAGCYGLTLGIATMISMPWLLVVGGIFIVFPIVVSMFYGQTGRNVQYKLVPDSPAIGVTATAFAMVAMLLHGSSIVVWAGPLLGVAAFIGMYWCLRRYGHFHTSARKDSQGQEREPAR
jgi:hypothetical protein